MDRGPSHGPASQECAELRYGPDGSGFVGLCSWPLGPFRGVAADEFVNDDGIAERFPEHRAQVGHGRGGERLAVAASAGQQVAVQLGDRGRPDGLDRQWPIRGVTYSRMQAR